MGIIYASAPMHCYNYYKQIGPPNSLTGLVSSQGSNCMYILCMFKLAQCHGFVVPGNGN